MRARTNKLFVSFRKWIFLRACNICLFGYFITSSRSCEIEREGIIKETKGSFLRTRSNSHCLSFMEVSISLEFGSPTLIFKLGEPFSGYQTVLFSLEESENNYRSLKIKVSFFYYPFALFPIVREHDEIIK